MIFKGENMIAFPLSWEQGKDGYSSILLCTGDLVSAINSKKNKIKRKWIEKEETELFLFVDKMIIYVENPTELTKGN